MPNTVSIDEKKVEGSYPADNNLHTGFKAEMTTNFGSGMAGASFGMYGISIGNGDAGSWGGTRHCRCPWHGDQKW